MRVHTPESKAPLHKVYMKQRLTSVLFSNALPASSGTNEDGEEEEDDEAVEEDEFEQRYKAVTKLPKEAELRKRRRDYEKEKEQKKFSKHGDSHRVVPEHTQRKHKKQKKSK